jgi:ribonucleoside-diphosphate reductase alpha chain
MKVTKRDGSQEPFDFAKIERLNDFATRGLNVDKALLASQIKLLIYDGMSTREIFKTQIGAAAGLISVENHEFTFVAARYLLADLYKEVTGTSGYDELVTCLIRGDNAKRYDPRLLTTFIIDDLQDAIVPERDYQFDYIGLQNVKDRYLSRSKGQIFELPQHFFMRVAMGLALNEDKPTERAIEFYNTLSTFDGMSSTPTLFNAGTRHPQLSSCYLNTVADQISADIDAGEHRYASIFGTIEESARLSKFAGGIGTDWTRVRGSGGHIESTNGQSSGYVPYLKVYNNTALAVNQGGKRKGAFASYSEPWHPDFMEYCELKKEFGDDRMRAHDIFPAAWVPDLLMKRKNDPDAMWSFFCPHSHPDLHELYGEAFEARYAELEAQGAYTKQLPAAKVWRHMIECLYETGHPWITFKDECNRRSPQDHDGIVHNSNLCTEITLNTSDTETAVCNLASVNLSRHMKDGRIDRDKLWRTVTTLMRMLDNVVDINYYPSDRARTSNLRHRPVGLGMMGETEAKVIAGIRFDSPESVEFSDNVMELISFAAITASLRLAIERGSYPSFEGSKWSKGILPIHTARSQESILGMGCWNTLAGEVAKYGMRNSNCMAIAPTATISLIAGTEASIEPIFEISRQEDNIGGSFTVVSPCVKYGRPDLLPTAFEVDQFWVIRCGARRQKWLDQAQSLNIYARRGTKGRDLAAFYDQAWEEGCKTTYYLRNQSDVKVPTALDKAMAAMSLPLEESPKFCSIDTPDCEACQ